MVSSDPVIYHARCGNHMTDSISHVVLGKIIGAPLNSSKIFKVEPQILLIPASMVMPMEEDGIPMGMPPLHPPPSATPSVTDLLQAHWAMSEWKIVSSTHLLTQCHDTGCDCHGSSPGPPCPSKASPPSLMAQPIYDTFRLASDPTGLSVYFSFSLMDSHM